MANYQAYVTAYDTLRLTVVTSSQSTENNRSNISWQLSLVSGQYGAINTSVARKWTVKIDGVEHTGTVIANVGNNTTKTLASGTQTINHNADGTKTISVSYSYNFTGITFSGTALGLVSSSGTYTLDRISTQPYVTGSNFTDEDNPVITYSSGSTAVTVEAGIASDGENMIVPYRNIPVTSSKYTFVFTDAERTALRNATPNSKTRTVIFRLRTKTTNGTIYGKTSYVTLTIVNGNPTLSPTVSDTNSASLALTGDANKMLKGFNTMAAVTNAAAIKGATIKSYKITCGGNTINAASGTFSNVENNTFTFTVTDSRGFTATKTVTKTLINYVPLTCNLDAEAPGTDGAMSFTVSGNYFNGSFGSKNNTLSVQYRYQVNDGSYGSWTTVTPTISGNTYSVNVNLTGLVYTNTYRVQARATDLLGTVESLQPSVKTRPVFDWGENDFNFNVPVTITDGYLKYPLMGVINAMTKTYSCDATISLNEIYKNGFVSATICGNTLTVQFAADWTTSGATGDIPNESVGRVYITHGGKISNVLRTSFNNGPTGNIALFTIDNISQTGEMIAFDIICTARAAVTSFNAFFQLPITLNLEYFVED